MFGKLKSSRTFGDWSIKKYGGVICKPHISVTDIKDDDLYLIIASEKVLREPEIGLSFVETSEKQE